MVEGRRTRVLFVCLGNICRSPLAESVFRKLVDEADLSARFEIDSAGTSGYHSGAGPDSRTVRTARARGLEVTGTSRQLTVEDLEYFDHVIVMDRENLANVERLADRSEATAQIRLLRDWDEIDPGGDVPDPYYGGPRGFDEVQDIVERSCESLLTALLKAAEPA